VNDIDEGVLLFHAVEFIVEGSEDLVDDSTRVVRLPLRSEEGREQLLGEVQEDDLDDNAEEDRDRRIKFLI
jgi:hypothetical protein